VQKLTIIVKYYTINVPRQASHQLLRAQAYLHRVVSTALSAGEQRLPTVAQLAGEAGVSHVTMWKALRVLKAEGVVSATHCRGIRVLQQATTGHDAVDSSATKRWERLCVQLERDILRGAYSPDQVLPTYKDLSRRYGACYRTTRCALVELCSRGSLVPSGATYRLAPPPGGHTGDTVVLVAAGEPAGDLRLVSPWTEEQLRVLEEDCLRRNVKLEVCSCGSDASSWETPGGRGHTLRQMAQAAHVRGLLIWTTRLNPDFVNQLVNAVKLSGKPQALLVIDTDPLPTAARVGSRLIRTYTAADSLAAGRKVGRFLLSLGHRRIAFISPVHGVAWSQRRREGLHDACRGVGDDGAVVDCVLPQFASRTEFIVEQPAGRREIDAILARAAERLRGRDNVAHDALRQLRASVLPLMKRCMLRERLLPIFEQALASRATAWVGANDEAALEALHFLSRRRHHVPDDLSVVGFDDSLEGFSRGLTSYSFNVAAASRAMLDFAQGMQPVSSAGRAGAVCVLDGAVMVRKTSGPPKGAPA
jgi:DNA-binding LacI/PurR family transcriptional regulator/DNA-binding transcriptional regulator YhcF (GntR family)